MSDKARQLFNDLAKEVQGRSITDVFEVNGRKYEMRLLNGEEALWRNTNILVSNQVSALSSLRLPTLAMGIRKIDDETVYDAFVEEWDKLPQERRKELETENKFSLKYFVAEHFMQFLASWPDFVLEELWDKWMVLEGRRMTAQEQLKKSSGEAQQAQ